MNNFVQNKTILIFGASGYIGFSLVNKLITFDCTIIRVSRDITKLQIITDEKIASIIDIEVNENKKINTEILLQVDIIYYLSSQTSIYKAQEDIELDFKQSVLPVLNILQLVEILKIKPIFIFSSAATICGLVDNLPIDESFVDKPITIYDTHKLLIENYIKYYTSIGVIKSSILRLANVYGQGVKSSSSDRGILNLMINKALKGKNLTIYGNGEFIRDYIYIDDVIEAFLEVIVNIKNTNMNYYYIGSEEGHTIKEAFYMIQKLIMDLYKQDIKVEYIKMPDNVSKIESRNFCANINRFQRDTSFKIRYSLKEGIKKTMKIIKEI